MEDTKSLLIMVLHKIFHDRPEVVENTYQMIYSYNSGRRQKSDYEKTLKSICDLMNDELPSEILVYLLTLVDMPQEDGGNQLPIMEKIQKTYGCLADSVRPYLLEYLSKKNSQEKPQKDVRLPRDVEASKTEEPGKKTEDKMSTTKKLEAPKEEEKFVKPLTKRTRSRKRLAKSSTSESDESECIKTLLDITANYVVKNEINLQVMYKSKLTQAWKMINSNSLEGETLKQCYTVIKDLNKKTKLLRCIENDNITADILMEEYGESEIFLRNVAPFRDPFVISEETTLMLKNFIGSC